ncbi:four-carbon acid sugar kinase family protein [Fodinibius salsisoli]|uniref:Four-carbon acid sugar kinase family protein n=1 Tax=Fodinibius salsisoli TaxID=2820877 RepID=A0ABT3PH83_9BACT|nr:four-carbon acid sugar kinase family protein [Fodinibius salsisoli]MCW9705270.1 four-carbon acid sugar kinase family protein [Fodinibius salsisoli]
MAGNSDPLLAFYGDDFTGSTDALEFMSRVGAQSILFMEPPTPDQLAEYEQLDAIGVAGRSRAMTPEEMEQELPRALKAMKELKARHIHYKVCSTFDSSPTIGSIGKVIDIAADIFDSSFIPLLVAAPALGRYCTFGNLFARMGIGSDGDIFRLDRHPSMKDHPITPADESDLRLHLGRQTAKEVGLLNLLEVAKEGEETRRILEETVREGADVVLFDALEEKHMTRIGSLIDEYGSPNDPLFSVGSSGIEMVLGNHWIKEERLRPRETWDSPGKAAPMLVVSGSRSPVTSKQIEWALVNGFEEVSLDTEALAKKGNIPSIHHQHVAEVVELLRKGENVIVHTSFGADDSRINATKAVFDQQGLSNYEIRTRTAQLFGTALGKIVGEASEQFDLQRVVFAGGDTSSFAAHALDIEALKMIAPIVPGAPLCKISASKESLDGLEVNIKGGQVGPKEYFGMVLEGKSHHNF